MNHTDNKQGDKTMTYLVKLIGALAMIYGFGLAFVIQDANLTYAVVSGVYDQGIASLDAYLTSVALCFGGLRMWFSSLMT